MITSLLRVVAALFALTFIVAACASDSGAQWTFAPVTVAEADSSESAGEAAPVEAVTPTETEPAAADAAEATEPEEPATDPATAASGDARVIALELTGALQILQDGQQVSDIPVTPGETIIFEIENTAGFDHNFYIGQDAELSVAATTTDTGIPTWSSGVQTLEWVVPDDISGLKFGCTVPGHYMLMQGTFSEGEAAPVEAVTPTEPEASVTPTEPMGSTAPATAAGEGRVVQIQADGALRFLDANGEQLRDIAVTPGETITFEVNNTAGFAHNFYIGEDSELMTPAGSTDTGIPDWSTGVQTLDWVVPDDISNLKFGCTVPGHYTLMQGTFSISA